MNDFAHRFPRLTTAVVIVALLAAIMFSLIALQWAVFRAMEARCTGTWHEGIVAGRWSGRMV